MEAKGSKTSERWVDQRLISAEETLAWTEDVIYLVKERSVSSLVQKVVEGD